MQVTADTSDALLMRPKQQQQQQRVGFDGSRKILNDWRLL